MEVVFILIPISLVIVGGAAWAFIWSVRHGQFEDLDKAAHSILFDEPEAKDRKPPSESAGKES